MPLFLCAPHVCLVPIEAGGAMDALSLELQTIVSWHVDAGI